MININFDNPWLLLVAVPLLALVIVPITIAINRDNRNKSVIASTIIHIVIVIFITLSLSGASVKLVMTGTEVFVVADVSYSSNANLDKVDDYIETVQKELPQNARLGVVTFGTNYELLTPLGHGVKSVKNSTVDNSTTDIVSALEYAGTLYSEGAIKKLVLITDGKQTGGEEGSLATVIKNLYAKNIQIDVMYLDNNASKDNKEVQISDVDFLKSTFMNNETEASVLVQSSYETRAVIHLKNSAGEVVASQSPLLTEGYNIVNFTLDTTQAGDFDYTLEIQSQGEDLSSVNNAYAFRQSIHEKMRVLALTNESADLTAITNRYGESVDLDARRITQGKPTAPCSTEELCEYDEIILSNIDVTTIQNYSAFVESLDIVVSQYGKRLITYGNLYIQDKASGELDGLSGLLPVIYGNNTSDPKLFAIVIDVSRSMHQASRLFMAKSAAKQIMGLMGEQDEICLVSFSASAKVKLYPTDVKTDKKRTEIENLIDSLEPYQGTYFGDAFNETYNIIKDYNHKYSEIQVMLISDGLDYSGEVEFNELTIAKNLYDIYDAPTSVINTGCEDGERDLKKIVATSKGVGKYYYVQTMADVDTIISADVAKDFADAIVKTASPVYIKRQNDIALDGITALGSVGGYVNSKAKPSATVVLGVDYHKSEEVVTEAPLYAYRAYGSGKVCTFTSYLTGSEVNNFIANGGNEFFNNVVLNNSPEEKIDRPYDLFVNHDGANLVVECKPAVFVPGGTITASVVTPSGETVEKNLLFDATAYKGVIECTEPGNYDITLTYAYGGVEKVTTTRYHHAYSPEYDSFTEFDVSGLYAAVRNMGQVTENGTVDLTTDERQIESYTLNLVMPLMIISVVLFVVDVAIRKLKWEDILTLFSKKARKSDGKGGRR